MSFSDLYQNGVITDWKATMEVMENQEGMKEEIEELKEIMLRVLSILEKRQSKPKEPKKTFEETSKQYQLAHLLFLSLRDVNESFKKKYIKYSDKQMINLIQKWCDPIDKLIRIDNQYPGDIYSVIKGVANDSFWSTVILSTENLRKNFTKLYPKFTKKNYNLNAGEVRTLS
jgi:hypothetical protein